MTKQQTGISRVLKQAGDAIRNAFDMVPMKNTLHSTWKHHGDGFLLSDGNRVVAFSIRQVDKTGDTHDGIAVFGVLIPHVISGTHARIRQKDAVLKVAGTIREAIHFPGLEFPPEIMPFTVIPDKPVYDDVFLASIDLGFRYTPADIVIPFKPAGGPER